MRSKVRSAFTLVEILIVVIILGILAAIVVPQFTSASEDAQVSNVETQLSTIRNQIELYRVRNNAEYPTTFAANDWGDPAGADQEARALRGNDYLRADPINPRTRVIAGTTSLRSLSDGTSIVVQAVAVPGDLEAVSAGWVWDDTATQEEIYAACFDEVERVWLALP